MESKKKLLETEIGSAEAKLGKYKTQQLGVRKNDEYQALGHEIETMQCQIGDFEGRELEIMYAIDEAKKKFAAAEAVLKQNIAGHEARIRTLQGAGGESFARSSRRPGRRSRRPAAPVAAPLLRALRPARVPRMPAVVPIRGGQCGGCHLKISSEAESDARGQGAGRELAACDQCGRIVYWEVEARTGRGADGSCLRRAAMASDRPP